MNDSTKGIVALVAAAALFGTVGAFIKLLGGFYSEPGQLVARSVVAVLLIHLLSFFVKSSFNIRKSQIKTLSAIGILYAVSTTCFIYAVSTVNASTVLFMLYVGVIIATQIMGALFFGEKFNRKNIIVLSLVSAAFITYNGVSPTDLLSIGLFIAFTAGVFEAITYAVRKKDASLTKESITLAQSVGALLIGIILLLTSQVDMFVSQLSIVGALLTLVLGGIYVGIGYLITYGMRHYSLSMGSVVLSSDLLFALIVNSLVIHQVPTLLQVVGSIILFVCILYSATTNVGWKSVLNRSRRNVPSKTEV